ncbi:MAG: hypothetical protein LBS96_02225 [Oscillospiraceae bacterium]|jgi:hypothetical protein|nr:hypothetical protein [Oscillospiraceae bacterium]
MLYAPFRFSKKSVIPYAAGAVMAAYVVYELASKFGHVYWLPAPVLFVCFAFALAKRFPILLAVPLGFEATQYFWNGVFALLYHESLPPVPVIAMTLPFTLLLAAMLALYCLAVTGKRKSKTALLATAALYIVLYLILVFVSMRSISGGDASQLMLHSILSGFLRTASYFILFLGLRRDMAENSTGS